MVAIGLVLLAAGAGLVVFARDLTGSRGQRTAAILFGIVLLCAALYLLARDAA